MEKEAKKRVIRKDNSWNLDSIYTSKTGDLVDIDGFRGQRTELLDIYGHKIVSLFTA